MAPAKFSSLLLYHSIPLLSRNPFSKMYLRSEFGSCIQQLQLQLHRESRLEQQKKRHSSYRAWKGSIPTQPSHWTIGSEIAVSQ